MIKRRVTSEAELRAAIADIRSGSDVGHILISPGEYYLEAPLELNEHDRGLTIEGEDGAHLFGGKKIQDWEESGGFFRANLPEASDGSWDFRSLSVNGRFAERARYPEEGYLLHTSEFDVSWQSTYEGGFERQPNHEELTTLHYHKGDLPEGFVPENAEITVFHMWDESLVGIASNNKMDCTLTFSTLPGWPPGAFTKEHDFEKRYVVWNIREGLTKPGQWFLDRQKGELVYYPLAGERIQDLEVIAPRHFQVIRIKGRQRQAEGITLKNLSISSTNAPLKSGAFGAKLFDGAVSAENTIHCSFEKLTIRNVGGHCLKAAGDDIQIRDCEFSDAGAGAIRLTGSRAVIRNNHINAIGKTFPSAIALYVGATDPNVPQEWIPGRAYTDCLIEHNEIHDVPYAAICAGGKNLVIRKNLIYNAMTDLYDGAGIYITWMRKPAIAWW